MELERYVVDLQRRLADAASIGGQEARELAERLASSLDSASRVVLLDALSTAASEISLELAPSSVEVRVRGGSPEFVVTRVVEPEAVDLGVALAHDTTSAADGVTGVASGSPASEAGADGIDPSVAPLVGDDLDGPVTRTTVRLPDALKTRVDAAAAREGLSVNAWFVRAVSSALDGAGRPTTPTAPPAPPTGRGRKASRAGRASNGGERVTGWLA